MYNLLTKKEEEEEWGERWEGRGWDGDGGGGEGGGETGEGGEEK